MANDKDEKYKTIAYEVNQTIRENLQKLLIARGLSQREFCKLLSAKKTSITRSYFNKILHAPENAPENIPVAFLLSCCDFFGITLNNLVSPSFNADEYTHNNSHEHKDYLDIEALLKKNTARHENKKKEESFSSQKTEFPLESFPILKNTNLITNPSHILFKGYLQDYFCYYYPTDSSENKLTNNILKGILQLKAIDNYCQATLKINTNTIDDNGNINYKEYAGYATISPAVHSMNCIMYSDTLCEFCFLMFRHFKLNFGKQDCRIAEVLSSSSGTEDRRPTVLRMFLSKEPIDDKDLTLIAPTFSLNYSTIMINQENLAKLANISDDYKKITNILFDTFSPETMFLFKENDILNAALKCLKNKEEALEFLMQLRASSYSYKYNKVGSKADENVRKILISKGYYQKKTP